MDASLDSPQALTRRVRVIAAAQRPPAARYAFALATSVIALALTTGARALLGSDPFLFLYASVTLSAWYGGLGAGLLATLLTVLGADLLVGAPHSMFGILEPADALRIALFILVAALVSSTSESLRRASERAQRRTGDAARLAEELRANAAELERQVAESRALAAALESARRGAVHLLEAERQARADAEQANRAKTEFLAHMSHELRTPLNAIGGYAQLLEMELRGPVTDTQRDDLLRIQRSQRHLLALINDVLNFARIETGHVHYAIAPLPLADALADVADLVRPQARTKGLSCDFPLPDPALVVRADRDKLVQVVVNLVSNAVKFTPQGGRVALRCATSGDVVEVRVSDTGIGIAADKIETIFEPFVQVDRGYTRTTEGTGLGLAISRDLARAMGGDICAASEVGRGSCFVLRLPRG